MKPFVLLAVIALAAADNIATDISANGHEELQRERRQYGVEPEGGVDFSTCQTDPETGLCCVEKEETLKTLKKDPILECTHKNVEKCHYTYVTQFSPVQEEVCEEHFKKTCQITFSKHAFNKTVKHCYKPHKHCYPPKPCHHVYETVCSTNYIEKHHGKFVGDSNCKKVAVEVCPPNDCAPEECHDKVITSSIDVPEEACDLNPQTICRFQTKLVPRLKPTHECTNIPKEVCSLKYSHPQEVDKPFKTRWCLDPTPAEPGDQYQEADALGAPLGVVPRNLPVITQAPFDQPQIQQEPLSQ